jgi:hypothetical protein
MLTRLPLPIPEPGQLQKTQAPVWNVTLDLIWRINEATSSTPIRKSSRRNMVRNLSFFDRHIRKHRKRYSYNIAMRPLLKSRDNNPAHEEFFNSVISALKMSLIDERSSDGHD